MSDEGSIKENIRARLKGMLQRIPARVNAGSVQLARDFKSFHAKAMKACESQRSTQQQLQSLLNQANTFYS